MAKSNPSLTSMTPHAAGERNFVDIHRDNTKQPTVKNLANNGNNGISGKSSSAKVKVFDRKKFHFGNDMDASVAGYDPKAHTINPQLEAVHIRSVKRTLGKKRAFIDEHPKTKKPVKEDVVAEMTRKDQLPGIEAHHTAKMHQKMDQQMWGRDDPTDPDRTGEISFHHAMRAWAARQRVDGSHIHDTSDFKGMAKFSKEMQKRGREKASKVTKEDVIAALRADEGQVIALSMNRAYQNRVSGNRFRDLQKTNNRVKDFDSVPYDKKKVNGGKPFANTQTVENESLPWLRTIAEAKAAQAPGQTVTNGNWGSENATLRARYAPKPANETISDKIARVKNIVLRGKK